MKTFATALAATLALASASSATFAAAGVNVATTQGAAYNVCHQQLYPEGMTNDHHRGPAIRACVERVIHGGAAAG